tara:strand:+ start:3150 stop:3875 length:726 start_codon:yes stop_codon:yes gene_type:complete
MFVNLFVLFICINIALGLVTGVEGSPLKVDMEGDCNPYPISTAPDIDPIIGNEFSNVNSTSSLVGEMSLPTNSTSTDAGWLGDGNPFNTFTGTIERGLKAMETMLNVVSGGYIMDIVENTTFDCSLSGDAFLTDVGDCLAVKQADGSDHSPTLSEPCVNPFYGHMIKPKVVTNDQAECVDYYSDNAWLDVAPPVAVNAPCFVEAPNEMWLQFKYGIYIIFSMLMVITIFYWLTGRGHILSG